MLPRANWHAPMAIALGAVAGALSRYYLTLACIYWLGHGAYGTFLVNMVGAWVMGMFVTLAMNRVGSFSPELMLLIGTGFLGALTTFSTYALDTFNLAQSQSVLWALVYWLSSAVCGVVCLYGGVLTIRLLQ